MQLKEAEGKQHKESSLESLGKSLASGFREEKGGDCPGEGTEAEDDGGKDGGELGEVDNHRREEDRDATDNFTEGNLEISFDLFVSFDYHAMSSLPPFHG